MTQLECVVCSLPGVDQWSRERQHVGGVRAGAAAVPLVRGRRGGGLRAVAGRRRRAVAAPARAALRRAHAHARFGMYDNYRPY